MGRHSERFNLKDYVYRGRHRAPASRIRTVTYLMVGLSVSGYSATSMANTLPSYLGAQEIPPTDAPLAALGTATEATSAAPVPTFRGTPDPTHNLSGSYSPSEGATESPVPTSTSAPQPTTPTQDQEVPTTTTEAPAPPPKAQARAQLTSSCKDLSRLNLLPHAEQAIADIVAATGFGGRLGGLGERPDNPNSDHPRGLAVDLSTSDLQTGNRIVRYAEENAGRLAVKYTLWQVEDHFDHVHISFQDVPGSKFEPRCD